MVIDQVETMSEQCQEKLWMNKHDSADVRRTLLILFNLGNKVEYSSSNISIEIIVGYSKDYR